MAGEWRFERVSAVANVTDFVANGSFESLRNNVTYRSEPDHAVLVRLVDHNAGWKGAFVYVDKASFDFLKKSVLFPGDIVIANVGANAGTVFRVPELRKPMTLGPNAVLCRPHEGTLDRDFLYYYLTGRDGQDSIASILGGSAQPKFNKTDFRSLQVPVPRLAEQKRIAEVLGTLDDKIELNRRMNATLEATARALFQSWFVDFDPVRAKLDGRTPSGMDFATAALFPDSFDESPLGHIPKGWEVKTAEEISAVGIGKTPPRKEHHWFSENPADVPWMSIRDLGEAGVFISKTSEFLTSEAVEKFRVRRIPNETVVLSFKLTMGRVAIADGEMLSNEAIAHFRLNPETPFGSAYLYCYLKGFGFDQLGSTSSIATAINSDMVRGIKVLVPSKSVGNAFEYTVAPIFAQMKSLSRESRTLATLRDTLLPKLLSKGLSVQQD
jgi:type I restriction enzyme S subunit